jgi:predicted transcriptional regulator
LDVYIAIGLYSLYAKLAQRVFFLRFLRPYTGILKIFLKTTNFFVDKYEAFRKFCRYRITNKNYRRIKMARHKSSRPTDRELTILRILWDHGPSTVRQVNEAMNRDGDTGYTTTLKLMQIMTEKGLLVRDESQWKHVYKPAITEERTQKQLVGDLLERAFSGSAEKLVMRALSAKKVSAKELARIRKMLDEFRGK